MTPTKFETGKLMTSTTAESAWTPKGGYKGPVCSVTLTWISGSFQFAIGPIGGSPLIDSNYPSITSADTKIVFGFNPAIEELRLIGTATILPTILD